MQFPLNLMVVGALLLMVGLTSQCWCEPLSMAQENVVIPQRPKYFSSPEELREYITALSNYYALVGRPRFGKRAPMKTMAKGMLSETPRGRYPPQPSDPLEQFFQYDE